ncbi:MAG: hypothetical protein ACTHMS_12165 [Jatrophihabitans sp.]|uniref:hypothetical protein n=1 Tax=Jatrophihabitans sp. TaxID=1932789 RepID=UPI003F808BA4
MVVKVAGGLIVAFVLFYVVVSPDHSAHMAEGAWHLVQHVAKSIRKVVDDLAS